MIMNGKGMSVTAGELVSKKKKKPQFRSIKK